MSGNYLLAALRRASLRSTAPKGPHHVAAAHRSLSTQFASGRNREGREETDGELLFRCDHTVKFRIASLFVGAQWAVTSSNAAAASATPGLLGDYGMAATAVTALASTAVVLAVPWFAKHTVHELRLLPACRDRRIPRRLQITPHGALSSGDAFEVALHNCVLLPGAAGTTEAGRDRFQAMQIFGKKSNMLIDKRAGEWAEGVSIETLEALLPSAANSGGATTRRASSKDGGATSSGIEVPAARTEAPPKNAPKRGRRKRVRGRKL
jgi:hypothetical protein